jgi:hypothetical protein
VRTDFSFHLRGSRRPSTRPKSRASASREHDKLQRVGLCRTAREHLRLGGPLEPRCRDPLSARRRRFVSAAWTREGMPIGTSSDAVSRHARAAALILNEISTGTLSLTRPTASERSNAGPISYLSTSWQAAQSSGNPLKLIFLPS